MAHPVIIRLDEAGLFLTMTKNRAGGLVRLTKTRRFSACRDTASEPLPGHQHPCYSAPRDTILIADKMNTLVTACQCYARCALQRLRWPHSALRRDRLPGHRLLVRFGSGHHSGDVRFTPTRPRIGVPFSAPRISPGGCGSARCPTLNEPCLNATRVVRFDNPLQAARRCSTFTTDE